jgi:hypothetical protein
MMRKGCVPREEWREEEGKKLPDYFFTSNPEGARYWETREEAEGVCKLFENRAIMIPSATGGEHRCTGFEVEELSPETFVVFCFAPFIPTGHSKI